MPTSQTSISDPNYMPLGWLLGNKDRIRQWLAHKVHKRPELFSSNLFASNTTWTKHHNGGYHHLMSIAYDLAQCGKPHAADLADHVYGTRGSEIHGHTSATPEERKRLVKEWDTMPHAQKHKISGEVGREAAKLFSAADTFAAGDGALMYGKAMAHASTSNANAFSKRIAVLDPGHKRYVSAHNYAKRLHQKAAYWHGQLGDAEARNTHLAKAGYHAKCEQRSAIAQPALFAASDGDLMDRLHATKRRAIQWTKRAYSPGGLTKAACNNAHFLHMSAASMHHEIARKLALVGNAKDAQFHINSAAKHSSLANRLFVHASAKDVSFAAGSDPVSHVSKARAVLARLGYKRDSYERTPSTHSIWFRHKTEKHSAKQLLAALRAGGVSGARQGGGDGVYHHDFNIEVQGRGDATVNDAYKNQLYMGVYRGPKHFRDAKRQGIDAPEEYFAARRSTRMITDRERLIGDAVLNTAARAVGAVEPTLQCDMCHKRFEKRVYGDDKSAFNQCPACDRGYLRDPAFAASAGNSYQEDLSGAANGASEKAYASGLKKDHLAAIKAHDAAYDSYKSDPGRRAGYAKDYHMTRASKHRLLANGASPEEVADLFAAGSPRWHAAPPHMGVYWTGRDEKKARKIVQRLGELKVKAALSPIFDEATGTPTGRHGVFVHDDDFRKANKLGNRFSAADVNMFGAPDILTCTHCGCSCCDGCEQTTEHAQCPTCRKGIMIRPPGNPAHTEHGFSYSPIGSKTYRHGAGGDGDYGGAADVATKASHKAMGSGLHADHVGAELAHNRAGSIASSFGMQKEAKMHSSLSGYHSSMKSAMHTAHGFSGDEPTGLDRHHAPLYDAYGRTGHAQKMRRQGYDRPDAGDMIYEMHKLKGSKIHLRNKVLAAEWDKLPFKTRDRIAGEVAGHVQAVGEDFAAGAGGSLPANAGTDPRLQFDPQYCKAREQAYAKHADRYAKLLSPDHVFVRGLRAASSHYQACCNAGRMLPTGQGKEFAGGMGPVSKASLAPVKPSKPLDTSTTTGTSGKQSPVGHFAAHPASYSSIAAKAKQLSTEAHAFTRRGRANELSENEGGYDEPQKHVNAYRAHLTAGAAAMDPKARLYHRKLASAHLKKALSIMPAKDIKEMF